MNINQALTRLRKTLGQRAGIRDCKRASSPLRRDAAQEARCAANDVKEQAMRAMKARMAALLDGDATYQTLKAEFAAALDAQKKAPYPFYRYTAGTTGKQGIAAMFFSVEAEADTLAELVDKVEAQRAKTKAAP